MEIEVSRTISMGHRLPSYDGICSSPHGHNVRVVARLETATFTDFKAVSDRLGAVLQDLDHAMVLHEADPVLGHLRTFGFRIVALSTEPTTEAIAALVFNELHETYRTLSGAPWAVLRSVTVHETDKYAATATAPDVLVRRCR